MRCVEVALAKLRVVVCVFFEMVRGVCRAGSVAACSTNEKGVSDAKQCSVTELLGNWSWMVTRGYRIYRRI